MKEVMYNALSVLSSTDCIVNPQNEPGSVPKLLKVHFIKINLQNLFSVNAKCSCRWRKDNLVL